MKKLFFAMLSVMALASCAGKGAAPKAIVVYYSQLNSTKAVAEQIATKMDIPIVSIEPVVPYDDDFNATIQRGQKEMAGELPEIKPLNVKLEDYDVIFLGYPIWFGTYATPMMTFLKNANLAGKKIVPFCSFGSGGLNTSVNDLKKALPDSEILPGYGVRAARLDAIPSEVDYFLKANGFLGGDFTPLPDFSAQAPATEEQKALFHAAVDSYGMIRAEAESAGVRDIPGGKEYLFTAREAMGGTIQVYVIDPDNGDPVFTQVVR
ncbi:MAG: hypothetical protein II019_03525 [Bacteroidales bacterium]|nr:hypothetical protein [Bacteroidales bacterium]